MAKDPILDLRVFTDRNFAFGASFIALIGLGMFSSMVLLALYSQKLLGYDALTSGLVLAPGGLGNMFSLILCGRLVTRVDQRLLLTFGCLVNAISLYMMSNLTLGMDYWSLTMPRVIQGFALGFIFVPLSTLTLATIRRDKLVNATSAYNVLRNLGGSVGIALATTYLAQRSQFHQHNLVSHVTIWDPATQDRLAQWTSHFMAQGADSFTAQRRALAMLYHDVVGQAQVLAYADDFWLLAILFSIVPLFLPLMRRVHVEPPEPREDDADGQVRPLPAPVD
jgi:DHA2 family multidrug resistance protein